MRREEKEIRDPREIEAILAAGKVCRLALADGGEPYLVPLNYGYRERTLYFHSAPEGRKVEMIRRNRRVCFQVDVDSEIVVAGKACGWGARYRSVIGYGNAEIVNDPDEKRKALDVLMAQYGEGPFTYDDGPVDAMVIIRVDVESWTGKKSKV
ncbi:MAG: pyridoxamine 5'-phosphate oxidase family protein [Candidatus Eisenbacteria bacterium]